MPLQLRDIDRTFFNEHLVGFLPPRIVDSHVHLWLKEFHRENVETRGPKWPRLVAADNSFEDVQRTYRLMLPKHKITPLVFSWPEPDVDLEQGNSYISRVARQHHLPSLMVTTPEWSSEELERRVSDGGFLGLKPYPSLAPAHLAADCITIFDFLPRHHLEVADAHGWIVVLHLPRSSRLKDPVNLRQMLEIERRYPRVRLIIAHIGRAYCPEDVGDAFTALQATEKMMFDFVANTNAQVMVQLIRTVGPKRVIFGSDLPIVRMRMRRICENGVYINLVPPGLYGDVNDPHMREVSQNEGERLSFFLYEVLRAFRCAAETTGLSAADIEDVFYNNAARLVADAGGSLA